MFFVSSEKHSPPETLAPTPTLIELPQIKLSDFEMAQEDLNKQCPHPIGVSYPAWKKDAVDLSKTLIHMLDQVDLSVDLRKMFSCGMLPHEFHYAPKVYWIALQAEFHLHQVTLLLDALMKQKAAINLQDRLPYPEEAPRVPSKPSGKVSGRQHRIFDQRQPKNVTFSLPSTQPSSFLNNAT